MDSDQPTYRDFSRWAQLPLEDIARECDVQVFRASGPGGQCVNTTDSAVRMMHLPSGLTVTSRESRSQFRNRQLCLQKLRRLFEAKARPPKVRRATKVPRRAKEARLADKRRRAETKAKRRRVEGD
ncbi:peptide chain release factor family protein [Gordonibacter massiliensis (ex Traore et al. 2017)]|uniref:Peptide chain release factor-like protein n=1 Tax=Gordonibacter massiliensis (ex Traore et al. 2017) TaxID=1841863 RepID=A0A842JC38_9ACTN|nr:peptide chain release factor-like protein [Gordonibacter massiliensis (ex Traore et al. 2017)]MBC2889267.1 peptide chain release factor-like protein [Gordonibacter massiliensis (ex Traore et al. 2017)]